MFYVYLSGRRVLKEEFVRAGGLFLSVGTVPLVLGALYKGLLPPPTFWASTLLCLPVVLGFAIGERLRKGFSEERFRQALLFVFFIMGLNLLRKAIFA